MSNFIDLCLSGNALLEEVDDYVGSWHSSDSSLELYKYLGMTKQEYSLWVADASVLPFIVTARHRKTDIWTVLAGESGIRAAARASSPLKAIKLAEWLKSNGLWE